jgi:hypothetical protein
VVNVATNRTITFVRVLYKLVLSVLDLIRYKVLAGAVYQQKLFPSSDKRKILSLQYNKLREIDDSFV